MKGDLILEKVNNPKLRMQWHKHLNKLTKALKKLNEIRATTEKDQTQMLYFEAVLEFMEARDNERNFFWDNFIIRQNDQVHLD